MTANLTQDSPQAHGMAAAIKSWTMVILTLIFVALYGAVFIGWVKPLADERMITHLEPIIFVIIGYYFGRFPGQQNEQTLKDEISRQTQKADVARNARDQSQQATERLEEKIKNARVALTVTSSDTTQRGSDNHTSKLGVQVKDEALMTSFATALKILDS